MTEQVFDPISRRHVATILFRIELRKPDGNPKPIAIVRGVPAGLIGVYGPDGVPLTPDKAQVRAALPHCYRAAFDRDDAFWFTKDDHLGNATCYLRGARGRVLGSIWATPYLFQG